MLPAASCRALIVSRSTAGFKGDDGLPLSSATVFAAADAGAAADAMTDGRGGARLVCVFVVL